MTEKFWQAEKARILGCPTTSNHYIRQTYQDARDLAPMPHPKAQYYECMKDSSFWHLKANNENFTEDELSMALCKEAGCALNYCSSNKMGYPSDW